MQVYTGDKPFLLKTVELVIFPHTGSFLYLNTHTHTHTQILPDHFKNFYSLSIFLCLFACEPPWDLILLLAKSSSYYLIHQEPLCQLKYRHLAFSKFICSPYTDPKHQVEPKILSNN